MHGWSLMQPLPSLQASKAHAPRSLLLVFFCFLMVLYSPLCIPGSLCNPFHPSSKEARLRLPALTCWFSSATRWSLKALMVFFCYLMVPPAWSFMVPMVPSAPPPIPPSPSQQAPRLRQVSHVSVPHLLVLLGDPLLSGEEPGFLAAVFQSQVLQGQGPHGFHEHRLGILRVPEVLEVVPGVGGTG